MAFHSTSPPAEIKGDIVVIPSSGPPGPGPHPQSPLPPLPAPPLATPRSARSPPDREREWLIHQAETLDSELLSELLGASPIVRFQLMLQSERRRERSAALTTFRKRLPDIVASYDEQRKRLSDSSSNSGRRFREDIIIRTRDDWMAALACNCINREEHKQLNRQEPSERKTVSEEWATVRCGRYEFFIQYVAGGTTRIHLAKSGTPADPSYQDIVLSLKSFAPPGSEAEAKLAALMLEIYERPDELLRDETTVSNRVAEIKSRFAGGDFRLTIHRSHAEGAFDHVGLDAFLLFLVTHLLVIEPAHALPVYLSGLDALELVSAGRLRFEDLFSTHGEPVHGGLYPLYNTGKHEGSSARLDASKSTSISDEEIGRFLDEAITLPAEMPQAIALLKALNLEHMRTN
ncbi:hypothetical protein ACSRUE_30440 [Sorangium sp. KYC3313]|uniref:hypothetical protein n=1 Tax=Sorangium sp. KYC3313 TaxID=3449740 RepID=UPI003F8CDACD